ncbi:hypothetical protein [Haloarcula amylovorans]|uniref:hypothetical protein n=1 Tax=Haloarcula amylovorans TaxID=2562280 RepID=UPI001076A958|nr:hypothetical protein [Halomicroarcula amylolytica]
MVLSDEPVWGDALEDVVQEYADAVVYADADQDAVLHEGAVRVMANGWVKLPTNRLLSPSVVHHIDDRSP